MAWTDQLQTASFRGIPFGVLAAEGNFGRRLAVHEYPFRDKPYIEDLGRATRRITFRAFLITDSKIYGGGDVLLQRARLIGAAESNGPGTLVHPSLGELTVSLANMTIVEKVDEGRYFELTLQFLESGQRIFPSTSSSTVDITGLAAGDLDLAGSSDFLTRAVSDLALGASVVNQVVSTATKWSTPALNLVRDATNLSHLASILPGTLGRYFGGANVGGLGALGDTGNLIFGTVTSVSSLITAGTQARALVQKAVDAFLGLAAQNKPDEFAAQAQTVAESVRAACVDPADGIRLLAQLAVSPALDLTTVSPVGNAKADVQAACNDLFRRAAVSSLARASSSYQPSSYDDAVRVRSLVTDRLDDEILIAGDQNEDASYQALRTLRHAVVQDLTDRGANLATITTFTQPSPLPSIYLANKIYRDPARDDQLVRQVDPVHPLFMPTSFKALSA